MAHLNVAAKRIETCIAYVGFVDENAFALDLVPANVMLGDCPVDVRLVAQRTATKELLRDADGVVVVLDAAEEENQSAILQVRAALGERATPVVVVANEVRAGAKETFQRAVGAVMQSITAEPTESDRASSFPQKKADGHPLMSALRRVLESTAEQQAQAISTRLASQFETRLDERLRVLEARIDKLSAMNERTLALESATDLLRSQLSLANEELLKSARHACSREDLATATADIRTEFMIMQPIADKLDDVLAKLEAFRAADPQRARELREMLSQAVARLDLSIRQLANGSEATAAADQERNDRVESLLKELLDELRKPKKGFFG